MKKRTFLKSLLGLLAVPFVGGSESKMERNLRARDAGLTSISDGIEVFTVHVFTDENGERCYIDHRGVRRRENHLAGTWVKVTYF